MKMTPEQIKAIDMTWKGGIGNVVFLDGQFQDYWNTYWWSAPREREVVIFKNTVFSDVLTFKGYGRGRSSAVFYFHSNKFNAQVQMFMSDMTGILQNYLGESAVTSQGPLMLKGHFTFVKKGQNYGIKYVPLEDSGV